MGRLCCADSKHPQADQGFFQRREICFTLDGDIFVRYQSFKVGAHVQYQLACQVIGSSGHCLSGLHVGKSLCCL